jgi:hypothetical protein
MPQPLSGCGLFAGNAGTDTDDDALTERKVKMKQGIAHNTTYKGILIVDDEYLIRNCLSMMLRGDDRESG